MYKIQQRKNVEATIEYFLGSSELSASEKRGTWIGRGVGDLWPAQSSGGAKSSTEYSKAAEEARVVVVEDMRAILRGYAPPSARFPGRPLNRRYMPEGIRRCAWDCVLSTHKSISIAALCLPDEHSKHKQAVWSAYDSAIQESFDFFEHLARRCNGKAPDVETGSLIAGRFDHQTSRWNDPQLHTHLLLANATMEPSKQALKRWYGLETLQYYRQAREIDMVFQRALVWHLRACGLHARIQKVDGLPVAVLPAVTPAICHRMSRAHTAIQREVDGRWEREERTLDHKRAENRYNDRVRPSKAGSLVMRQEVFGNALRPEELKRITAALGQSTEAHTLPQLTDAEINQAVYDAGLMLGYGHATPGRLTRAAIYAAAAHLDMPFIPFWYSARKHLGWFLAGPTSRVGLTDYEQAFNRHWHAETEVIYGRRSRTKDGRFNLDQSPQTEHNPALLGSTLVHVSEPQVDGTTPASVVPEMLPETPPPFDGQDSVAQYLLPPVRTASEEQQNCSGLHP